MCSLDGPLYVQLKRLSGEVVVQVYGPHLAGTCEIRPKSVNDRDVTKRAIIGVNSIVSGRNYASIIAQLLTLQRGGGGLPCKYRRGMDSWFWKASNCGRLRAPLGDFV